MSPAAFYLLIVFGILLAPPIVVLVVYAVRGLIGAIRESVEWDSGLHSGPGRRQ